MMYNGLQNDMTSFAKFAFIFEQEIKVNVKNLKAVLKQLLNFMSIR